MVHTAPAVSADAQSGWELTFWLGDAFDFSIPFRASLEEIARLIGEKPADALTLPPLMEGEDFVEGTLRFGTDEVRTYYEFSLGYLSLFHQRREPLDFIAAKTAPAVRLS